MDLADLWKEIVDVIGLRQRSSVSHVGEIQFNNFRPVQYPKMMEHLWQ